MKRIFRFAVVASAVAALLASCNKEEVTGPQDRPVEEVKTKTINVVGTLSGDATKVTFADGTGFAWEQVDLTSMAIASTKLDSNGQDSKYNAQNTVSKEGRIDGGKAYFTFEVPADHVEGYLFYPNVQVGWYEIHFQFPATIAQAEAGTTDNLKLISEKIDLTTTGSEEVEAKFRINGHLLRYFIYDSEGASVAVKSVTLKTNANIAGQYTVRPEGPEAVGGALSTNATVTLTTPYALEGITSTAQAKSVFMPIIPATSEGYTYQVTTEAGDIYEFESSNTKAWEDGAITEVALNLSKATNFISSSDVPKKELVFEFTNKGVSAIERSFTYSGGTVNTDYFIVMVDGQEVVDYDNTYYNDFHYEIADASGNAQDWVAAYRSSKNNSFDIVCQANDETEARSATINIYFDDTDEYEVVGTYKTLDKQLTSITCEDPILTLTITQEGKPELPDGPQTLDFHFADKNQTNTIPLELTFPIGGEHKTMAQGHTVEINGVEQQNPFTAEYTFKVVDEDGNEVTDQSIVRPYVHDTNQINIQVGNNASNPERIFYVHMYFSNFDESQYKVNSTVKSATETINATHFQGNLAGVYAADGKTEVTTITDPETEPVYTVKIVQAGVDLSVGPQEIIYLFSTDKFGSKKGVSKFDYSVGSSAGNQDPGWFAVAIGREEANQTADGNLPYFKNLRYEAVDAEGNSITWLSGRQKGKSNESRISWEANETGVERTGYVKLYLDPTDAYKVVGTYTEAFEFIPLEPDDAVATFTVTQAAQ